MSLLFPLNSYILYLFQLTTPLCSIFSRISVLGVSLICPWYVLGGADFQPVWLKLTKQYTEVKRPSVAPFPQPTTTVLSSITFLETVTACIDNKLNADTIYLDLAKAFDKVPHEHFLHSRTSDCFSNTVLLCSSVCFIFISLFLFSFWSRVVD